MSINESSDANLIPTTIIDEEAEFKTNIEFTEIMDGDCLTRILKKFTKGYKTQTIISMISSSLTLITFSLPYTIETSGILVSFGLCLIIFFFTFFTMYILLEVILKTNAVNYHQLIYAHVGQKMCIVYEIFNFVYLFSLIIIQQIFSYLLIYNILKVGFGIYMDKTVEKYLILLIPMVIQIPLSLLKKFNQLSLFTMICAGIIIVYIFVSFFCLMFNLSERKKELPLYPVNMNVFYTYAIFTILFGSHNYLFSIFNQFMLKTKKRSTDVILYSHLIEIMLFLIMTVIGYFYSTNSDSLSKIIILQARSIPILIVQILLVICIQFLIPISITNIKECIKNTISNAPLTTQPLSLAKDIVITIIVLLLGNVCVFFTQEVKLFIGISGGICSGIICYMIPYFVYCKIFEESNYKHYLGFVIMLFNFLASGTATVHSFIDLARTAS